MRVPILALFFVFVAAVEAEEAFHHSPESLKAAQAELLKGPERAERKILLEALKHAGGTFPCELDSHSLSTIRIIPEKHTTHESKKLAKDILSRAEEYHILSERRLGGSESSLEDPLIYVVSVLPPLVLHWARAERDKDENEKENLMKGLIEAEVKSDLLKEVWVDHSKSQSFKESPELSQFVTTAILRIVKAKDDQEQSGIFDEIGARARKVPLADFQSLAKVHLAVMGEAARRASLETLYPGFDKAFEDGPEALKLNPKSFSQYSSQIVLRLRSEVFFRKLVVEYCNRVKSKPFYVLLGGAHVEGLIALLGAAVKKQKISLPVEIDDRPFEFSWFKSPAKSDVQLAKQLLELKKRYPVITK